MRGREILISELHRIPIPRVGGANFVNIEDIIYIKSENTQSSFYLPNRPSPLVVNYRLGKLEALLEPLGFIRIHREFIVNLRHIVSIDIYRTGIMLMSNGDKLPVGRVYLEKFKKDFLD